MSLRKVIALVAAALVAGAVMGSMGVADAGTKSVKRMGNFNVPTGSACGECSECAGEAGAAAPANAASGACADCATGASSQACPSGGMTGSACNTGASGAACNTCP